MGTGVKIVIGVTFGVFCAVWGGLWAFSYIVKEFALR